MEKYSEAKPIRPKRVSQNEGTAIEMLSIFIHQ